MLLKNISRLVTMEPGKGRKGPLGVIEDACVLIKGDGIEWLGRSSELPKFKYLEVIDFGGDIVLPGLVDCHTHLIYAGSREKEFRMRSEGATYLDIAKAGGGILSTVKATRDASEEVLLELASRRADEFLKRGVTTIEVKSGYGLSIESERKMLEVARSLDQNHPIGIVSTLLAAHVIPPEFIDNRDGYVNLITGEMIPAFAHGGLCRFCDIFVEEGAFTPSEARTIAHSAAAHGLGLRLHVDQFGDGEGGELAAELGAASADHLDFVSARGIKALGHADVVAVVLPAASCFVSSKQYAPARKIIDNDVRVAVSTDYNPGSSPTTDLLLCATMAVTQMGLTVDEALFGITKNAAKSLGLEQEIGSLAPGKKADLVSFGVPNEDYLLYRFGTNFVRKVIKNGRMVELKGVEPSTS